MRNLLCSFIAVVCSTLSLAAACSSGDLSVGNDEGTIRRGADASRAEAADGASEAALADTSSSEAGTCSTPNPAGCVSTGCPTGQKCEVGTTCAPSSCACDAVARAWTCTADCNGGRCVAEAEDAGPADTGVDTCGGYPNPAGCVGKGCPAGKTCQQTTSCVPSACTCMGNVWTCTADCSGGECI